MQNEFPTF